MTTPPFMPRGLWLLGALGSLAILVAAIALHQPTEPIGSTRFLDELLAERTPHPVATPAGEAQAQKVARLLASAIGAPAVIDGEAATKSLPTTGPIVAMQRAEVSLRGPVKVANVVGRIRGKTRGPATMLVAHHDSVAAGPGAGDDGSGVVSVLQAARALAKEGTQRDVIILLTDGEEAGLLGAIAFCAEHPWFHDVGAVVNVDSRGASGPCHVYELGFNEGALVPILSRSVPRPVASSLADMIAGLMPNGSDFRVFEAIGLPGFNLACVGSIEHYHQPTDLPENFDPGTLGHLEETTLALARGLDRAEPIATGVPPDFDEWRSRYAIGDPTAMQELRAAKRPALPEPARQSYASHWKRWTISWDAELSPLLAGGVLLVVLIGLTVLWRRGLFRCGELLGAMGRLLLALCAAAGAAISVAWGCSLIGKGSNSGWMYSAFPRIAWPWVTAVWAVAFVAAIAAWQLVPRRSAWANVGAVVIIVAILLGGVSGAVPATAAMALPVVAVAAAALLLASILPRAVAGIGAGFVGCVQLWALSAVLFPLAPSLVDATGFSMLPLLLIPPLLMVAAFVALLPGAAARGSEPPVPASAVPAYAAPSYGMAPAAQSFGMAPAAQSYGVAPAAPSSSTAPASAPVASPESSPWRPA